jgi:hypothetical protein
MSPHSKRSEACANHFCVLTAPERVSNASDADVFNEILLAALLKLCNAAEEFLRAELKNLAIDARSARKTVL